jgi:hypothetical protein
MSPARRVIPLSITAAIAVAFAVVCAVVVGGVPAHAQDGAKPAAKNLQVLPKDIDKDTLKEQMKELAKAVGKKCDGCHDVEAFDKDTEMKTVARGMMKMTGAINAQLAKAKLDAKVTCMTCHHGKEEPDR